MIIGEIEVKDENKDQRILCSYEEFCRLDERKISEQYGNEKQLKENIEIEIDGQKIPFCYTYRFKNGKHTIKYIQKGNTLKNMSYMFNECTLKSLDFSKFNSENVTDMSRLFDGSESLENINLSNLNTQNLTNMYAMFSGCKALKSIDLSKLNTENVKEMGALFCWCVNLTDINFNWFKY